MGTIGGRGGRLALPPSSTLLRAALWTFPLVIGLVVRFQPDRVELGLKAMAAAALVAVVARAPHAAIRWLVVVLPFQAFASAWLYHLGLPAGIVAALGLWKEAAVLGLVVAAGRAALREGHRVDALDGLGLFLVANNLLYRFAPGLFVRPPSPFSDAVAVTGTTADLAFRDQTLFLVLFLAARHLPQSAEVRARFARTVIGVGIVIATLAVVEYTFSDAWNDFAVETIDYPGYRAEVLSSPVFDPQDIRVYTEVAGRQVVRVGSVFVNQLALGAYLLLGLSLALERLARGVGPRATTLAGPLILTAILLTQTRAAVLGAIVVAVLAARSVPGRTDRSRTRFATIMALGLIPLVPFIVAIGLADRANETIDASDTSTQLHQDRTSAAFRQLVDHPLGSGLGTTGENARRGGDPSATYTENQYLSVGNETGAQAMLAFVGLLVVGGLRLHRRLQGGDDDVLTAAWSGALAGLVVVGMFLLPWGTVLVSWPFWAGLGLVLPSTGRSDGGQESAGSIVNQPRTRR